MKRGDGLTPSDQGANGLTHFFVESSGRELGRTGRCRSYLAYETWISSCEKSGFVCLFPAHVFLFRWVKLILRLKPVVLPRYHHDAIHYWRHLCLCPGDRDSRVP